MSCHLVNSNHALFVKHILESSFAQALECDVVFRFSDSKHVIKCHRAILSAASPFFKSLFNAEEAIEVPVEISLPEVSYNDAMAVLSLVYTGQMMVTKTQISTTSKIIEMLSLRVNNNAKESSEEEESSDKDMQDCTMTMVLTPSLPPKEEIDSRPSEPKRLRKQTSSKRPLLMKMGNHPMVFVLPNASDHADHFDPLTTTVVSTPDSASNSSSPSKSQNNSYQRAKRIDKQKFKCDVCGRGFPLACLLRRHKIIHSDKKPFQCNYCSRDFTTKASWQHHEFAKHLEQKSLEMKKKQTPITRIVYPQEDIKPVHVSEMEVTVDGSTPDSEVATVIEVVESSDKSGTYTYNIPASTSSGETLVYSPVVEYTAVTANPTSGQYWTTMK